MGAGTFTIGTGHDYTTLDAWYAAQADDLTGHGPCIAECHAYNVGIREF